MLSMPHSVVFEHDIKVFTSSYLVQSKHIKLHQQEIPPIDHNVFEISCEPLYTDDYLSNLYKKASSRICI